MEPVSVLTDQLIPTLKTILGEGNVVCDRDELLVYECDALPQHRVAPRAVVFPHSTEEVAEVVRFLSGAQVPFTARGAGTGISGGALAIDDGVVIELARMRSVLDIDPENRTATVQTGLINSHLSAAAAAFDLYYAPDPSSQTACTIGGNIAENSGGNHCLKYGVTVDHVISARVVLSDGSIVDLNAGTPGYDLVGVFVGSEGTFGIATEARLKLLPVPPAVRTILADFPDVNDASRAVSAIIAEGLVPAALEMIDAATIRAVEASVFAAGLPTDAGAALIIELDGLEAGIDVEAGRAERICREHGARGVRRALDELERQKIWKARKGAFGAMGRISPDVMIQDAVVPRSKLPGVLAETYRIADRYGLLVANVFHAGDGNLHPLICFDSRNKLQLGHVKDAGREIMETCVVAGGTITGEHGVGLDKIDYLPLIFSDDDMETMLRVRAAFDPIGLCNPGKVIPVRRGCGEKRILAGGASSSSNGPNEEAKRYSVLAPRVITRAVSPVDPERTISAAGRIVGEANVRAGSSGHPVAAFPDSIEQISELLRLAQRESWAIVPAGSGMWLDAGNPLRHMDLEISTSRLDRLIEYEPADLVTTVEAGMKLADLNGRLNDQWLALDPPDDGRATIGGIAATGSYGPQAHGYGPPRHHIIGMRVALADGRVIKTGGRVVKNVAGYDLCKLFTGSFGTLGIIVEVTCRLRPRPATESMLAAESRELAPLLRSAKMVLGSELLPVAVELVLDGGLYCLLIRFAGEAEAVNYQMEKAAALIGRAPDIYVQTISPDTNLWKDLERIPADGSDRLFWRATVPRMNLEEMLQAVERNSRIFRWRASVGLGLLRVAENLTDSIDEGIASLGEMRQTAVSLGGNLFVESAPSDLKIGFDVWGDPGSSFPVMKRIKEQLDGQDRFSPGRFVAEI